MKIYCMIKLKRWEILKEMNKKMNLDEKEMLNFDNYAHEWWNKRGPYKLLHKLNPLRLKYIEDRVDIDDLTILDIGCGGGILSEALSKKGAKVTSIDASDKTIKIAKKHAVENNLKIDYKCCTLDEYIKNSKKTFDCIVCFELIEHVPDPKKLLEDINRVSKPSTKLFLSTINRNLHSFIFAKILAEYFLKIVPKGTHEYQKFIKPSEVSNVLELYNYKVQEITGMVLNPITFNFQLSSFSKINYFLYATKLKK